MKRKFYDTRFSKTAGIGTQFPQIIKFMIENRRCIMTTQELITIIQPVRTILKSPMTEFFNNLVLADKLPNFAAINLRNINSSIPQILTASNITMDLKQCNSTLLTSLPEIENKIIINITETIRVDRVNGTISLAAVDNFQNLFCRGALVGSYYDADEKNSMWLTPSLTEFTLKSYSMILSALISRYYNLSLPEQYKIGAVLAYAMAQRLSVDPNNPTIFYRATWLGSVADLTDVAKLCEEHVKNGELDLEQMVELIKEVAPDRMKNFNLLAFVQICGNLGPDLQSSYIALEYAPYWVYLIILALSGAKIPLVYQLTNQRLINEGRSTYINALLRCENIFGDNFQR